MHLDWDVPIACSRLSCDRLIIPQNTTVSCCAEPNRTHPNNPHRTPVTPARHAGPHGSTGAVRLRAVLVASLLSGALTHSVQGETVRVTISGRYEYVGAAPSPTADFTLTFTLDRHPVVCGGSIGASLICGVSRPVYDNGPLHAVLGEPTLLLRNAEQKGGLAIYQDDLGLNRLGFVIGTSQLWSGTLADLTLLDGIYDICPAHAGQVHPEYMSEMCSYAGQGFASGDPVNNPFLDPVTLQSDNPILSGTVRIARETPVETGPALAIAATPGRITLQWDAIPGFVLEQCSDLETGTWGLVPDLPTLASGRSEVSLVNTGTVRFFRLRQP